MKRWVIVLSMLSLCLFGISASAQLVLSPSASGTVNVWNWVYNLSFGPTGTTSDNGVGVSSNYIQVGKFLSDFHQHSTYWGYGWSQWNGVLEFPLTGLPTSEMTENNWTARLNGLSVTYAIGVGEDLYVILFDLHDIAEDNVLSTSDWDTSLEYIHTLCSTVPSVGSTYDNIDVTDVLRRDLFGEGATRRFDGFHTGFSYFLSGW